MLSTLQVVWREAYSTLGQHWGFCEATDNSNVHFPPSSAWYVFPLLIDCTLKAAIGFEDIMSAIWVVIVLVM